MALAVCHVLCWPALSVDIPIAMTIGIGIAIAMAMAHVLTLSMSLGLALDRWPGRPLQRTMTVAPPCCPGISPELTWFDQVISMPFHAMPCQGGLFWQYEVCWWLLIRLFWQTVAVLV